MNQSTEDKAVSAMNSEIVKNYISNGFRIVMSIAAFAALSLFNDLTKSVSDLKDEIHMVNESVHGVKEKIVELDAMAKRNRADIESIQEFNERVHQVTEKK